MRPMWRLSCAMALSLMAGSATTPGVVPTGAATPLVGLVGSADGAGNAKMADVH